MSGQWWLALSATIAGLLTFVLVDEQPIRAHLVRFASRHSLMLTPASATHLARYLAPTRRWRYAGLMAAITAYLINDWRHHLISVNIAYSLIGWFAGAVIAEVRAKGLTPASHRIASLEPRDTHRYVTRSGRSRLLTATLFCPIAATAGAVAALPWTTWAVPLVAAAILWPLVSVVSRRVAERPQAVGAADVVAVDEAIRSISVQTLHGAALALLLYAAAGPVVPVLAGADGELTTTFNLVVAIGVPLLGWKTARQRTVPIGVPTVA